MKNKVMQLLDGMENELTGMLSRWIQIPSVKDEPAPGAPFGTEVRRMLDMAVADAKAMGFATREFDGYACDITLGDAEETIAVLGHLDVVPAGDGWSVDPFAAVRDGDKLIGRGTSDDKGPSLAALFAMKAIKDAGVPLKKSIRLILGCDEESGWEDMAYYAAHADMPEVGFSPDSAFPIINTEKAMLHMVCKAPVAADGLQVKYLHTGERMNVIPGESVAIVAGGQDVADQVAAYAAKTGLPYTAEVIAEGVKITAEGIPGHSAYPEGRRNAIGIMLLLLKELGVKGALLTLANTYGMESDGASLGCACEDEVSGALTCNMGILHLDDGVITATLDMRVPITADLDKLEANAQAALPGFDVPVIVKK
ncbi:MAG: Sapep family Mn(2+)-dependent dipeptidase, partial [Clostridia bacterium]|nr:Sapep family Mn(2+)-dependent dipeptidase [Clostridia bacterium]